nr:protein FAR1-RELATED SEQUENCE 5-like [Lolium perenne]
MAVQLGLLPVRFTSLTLHFISSRDLFGSSLCVYKRGRSSPETHDETQDHMRLPLGSRALRRRSRLLHPVYRRAPLDGTTGLRNPVSCDPVRERGDKVFGEHSTATAGFNIDTEADDYFPDISNLFSDMALNSDNVNAVMDGSYYAGGLDLNEPANEEQIEEEDMSGSKSNNPDVTKSSEHSKLASGSNTGASADTETQTGQTLSTDDSGEEDDDDDEVQSTPCSQDINELEAPPVRQRNRSITKKTECKARLRIKRRGKKWHVTYFIEEHNHKLIKKFSLKKYLRSHKGIPKEEKDFVKLLHKVNLSAGRVMRIMGEVYGGLANVPYDSKDVRNYMAKIDEEHAHKDMSMLLAHFARMKKEDPDFYFNLHTDHADKVDRIFWVDGPTIAAYKNYSDCLSFDTTYITNMYNMPFAPFIGINRYCQTIQLGCGFLKNENIESFEWLFKEFLEAMGGVQPDNFITDQDAAMRCAILSSLPLCCHRNCRWHIMQNAQAVLGNFLSKHEELRQELNAIIDYSMSIEEFESRWAEMIFKHDVADNTHLSDLYNIRATFVPAYFKDRFFPFLQTTARSEGFNAVLKSYVDPHNNLHHFFEQYLKLQEKIDVAEDSVEFKDEDKTVRVWGDYPLEEQALTVYTLPMYLRFRAELRKVTSYNVQQTGGQTYVVMPIKTYVYGYGDKSYKVEANLDAETYICECCKFSRDGLLCCHIFRVMVQLGTTDYIPERYILPRWRKPEETIVQQKMELPQVPTDRKMSNKERQQLRYGTLCNKYSRVAKIASTSDKGKALADKYMLALEKELQEMKAT